MIPVQNHITCNYCICRNDSSIVAACMGIGVIYHTIWMYMRENQTFFRPSDFFAIFYSLTLYVLSLETGVVYTMFVAWMGLFYKVYPCAMLAGIILSTTSVNEFLTAMNKAHVSKGIYIPLAVMLRYLPTIREDWHFIKDGMRLRDISLSFQSFIRCPGMTIECLYVPLLMTASKAADELAIASVTRGIENPHSRTCLIQIKFRIQDILLIICFLFLLVLNAVEIGGAV